MYYAALQLAFPLFAMAALVADGTCCLAQLVKIDIADFCRFDNGIDILGEVFSSFLLISAGAR